MQKLSCLLLAGLGAALSTPAPAQQPDLYDETVLRTFELTFAQSNWWSLLVANYASEQEIPADLTVEGVVYAGVGVRFKGNSSYQATGSSEKKSFKIVVDFTDPNLDLYGYETLNLNNAFLDPTFTRDVLTNHLMRDYVPAPKANHVKLVINGQNWGVYAHVQQVNKDFMDEWFEDDEGNRYKGERGGPGSSSPTLTWLGSSSLPYQQSYELKSENSLNPWVDLIEVCDVLNNRTTSQLEQELPQVFAVDRALWYLALTNVFANLDSYIGSGHNFYLIQDLFHERLSIVPWDVNEAFGVFTQGLSGSPENLDPLYRLTDSQRPLVSKMLAVPRWRARYFAHLRTVLDDVWNWQRIGPLVQTYQSLIAAEVAADPKKLYTTAQFTQNVTQTVMLGNRRVPGLQSFVNARRSYLLSRPEVARVDSPITAVSHAPIAPTSADVVWVNATVPGTQVTEVSLHHRFQGGYVRETMFDDGQHHDGSAGDGVYGCSIPTQIAGASVTYFVTSWNQVGAMAVSPKSGAMNGYRYQVSGTGGSGTSVVLNEFMAKNETTIQDAFGEYDDWIELHNPTALPVTVGGMYLSDNVTNPTKFQLPAGQVLQPGAFLMVWADEDGSQGPLHANFKLGASGEEIFLYDTDGITLLDSIVFGPQLADVATGRLADGTDLWVSMLDATPDANNSLVSCGSRRYSALDTSLLPAAVALTGSPQVGTNANFDLAGLPAAQTGFMMFGFGPTHFPLGFDPAVLLIEPPAYITLSGLVAPSGTLSLSFGIPNDPALAGLTLYFQAFAVDGGGLVGSNGLIMKVCP